MFVLFLIVLNRKTKYFGRLDVLILYASTLLGASLTGILRTAFLCTGMDSVGNISLGPVANVVDSLLKITVTGWWWNQLRHGVVVRKFPHEC